jgi:rhamnosyltransferase
MRRLAIYLFFDTNGVVDEYVSYKLARLREHVDRVLVVVNGLLTEHGRALLESVSDEILVRENVGYDVGGYQEALLHVGFDEVAQYDEVILLNYTFFGPVTPFGDLFDRMDALDVDFWGLTEHRAVEPNPFENAPDPDLLPAHIQSTWLAMRKPVLTSPAFADYWTTMPVITSYDESVLLHEARFTQYFHELGFRSAVAYPESKYPSGNAALDHADMLLDDGCPMVKRRVFFMDPVYMIQEAVLARRAFERLAASTYPIDLAWRNLVRTTPARTLLTNLALLEVLDDRRVELATTPRVAIVAHVYYLDMLDEIVQRCDYVPIPYDLIITTDTPEKAEQIRTRLYPAMEGRLDVRVVGSNAGRDISAFVVGCADVLMGDRYDLICKIHTKRSPQDGFNRSLLFKEYLFDNLLGSPGYVSQVLRLFEENATLGAVFPPVVNIGYPTLGHAWFTNREPALELAAELGIDVPLDEDTPVAPLGSMFWARPDALRPLVARGFSWSDFERETTYGDGGLPHVIERLFGYAALAAGYHVRAAMTPRWATVGYTSLEYRLQLVASQLPAWTKEQLDYIGVLQEVADNPLVWLRRRMGLRHPTLAKFGRPAYVAARGVYRGVRRVAAMGAGRSERKAV